MNSFSRYLPVFIVVLAALCVVSLLARFQSEQANKSFAIVAEWDQLKALSAAQGVPLDAKFSEMQKEGLSGIVASEETIGELISSGELTVEQPATVSDATLFRPSSVRLRGSPSTLNRVIRGLKIRFSQAAVGLEGDTLQVTGLSSDLIRSTSVGLPLLPALPDGMILVARHANPAGASDSYGAEMIKWSAEHGADYFLPAGEQVLGRRGGVQKMIEELRAHKMLYASPEFAKIAGDQGILAAYPDQVVRLHAAQAAEMDKLTESGAIERYAKAATERNTRLLLLRPISQVSERPLDEFIHLAHSIATQSTKEGLTIRAPRPFEDPNVPRILYVGIGLAFAFVGAMVWSQLFGRKHWELPLLALFGLLGIACWTETGRNLAALAGAVTMPIAAIQWAWKDPKRGILLQYALVTGISVIGGFMVSALLTGAVFMVRGDQFSGVKMAHFAPIPIVGIWVFSRYSPLKNVSKEPILWAQAAIGLVLAAGLGFMLSRTGNDNPAGVSGLEMQFRALLEKIMVVRPRTKEIFIGFPALFVGLGMLARCQIDATFAKKWHGWTALVLMVGTIGTTSIVNTMCHLHTPLQVGFTRIIVGWFIGGCVGYLAWLVLSRRFFGGVENS